MQPQPLQWLVKIMLRGECKAMNRVASFLTQVHFVNITFQYLVFVVMQFEEHRHHKFCQLTHDGAFGREVIVFHQLLGDGTSTSNYLTRTHVAQRGPGDAHN